MKNCKTYQIPYSQVRKQNKLVNDDGYCDLLGAILVAMGYDPFNMKFPSELKKEIFPFTMEIKRKIVDTEITLKLCRLSELPVPSPRELEEIANTALNGYLKVEIVH